MNGKTGHGTWTRRALLVGGCLAACAACGDTAFTAGEWDVAFAAEGSTLKLTHRASGIEVSGELAFLGPEKATDAAAAPKENWKVGDSRDGEPHRLALIDCGDAVRGHVAFQQNGARLNLLVFHREAMAYQGQLSFAGEIHGPADGFAANTLPVVDERVLQLSSGPADSANFNSIFSPGRDEAFQILSTLGLMLESGAPGTWSFEAIANIEDPAAARMAFNVERGYYRSRWTPRYAPIDRKNRPCAPTGWAGGGDLSDARIAEKCLVPFGIGERPGVGGTGADAALGASPAKWADLLGQARLAVGQMFRHGIVSWADPGPMTVGQDAFGIEQARVEATLVALPGQRLFAGDKLGGLAPDRIWLLQRSLPACDVRPGNLYPQFGLLPVWNLGVRRPFGSWHVVALFNWGDDQAEIGFEWGEIGEAADTQFLCWEFWTETWQGVNQERFAMQVPPHTVRLMAMQPYMAHPQFLTSDRHVTQGGVDLKGQQWADDVLRVTLGVVGGFPTTARFFVPESFEFKSVSVPDGVTATARREAGGKVVAVTLAAESTRDVPVTLAFRWPEAGG